MSPNRVGPEQLDRIVAHLTQPLGVRRVAAPTERKSWNGWKVGDQLEVVESFYSAAVGQLALGTIVTVESVNSAGINLAVPQRGAFRWVSKDLASRLLRKVPKRRKRGEGSGSSPSGSRSKQRAPGEPSSE